MPLKIIPYFEALKLLNTWSCLLLLLQTAILITLILTSFMIDKNKNHNVSKLLFISISFSILSLLIGVNVIGTIPWSTQNLYKLVEKYGDIYQFPNFLGVKIWVIAFAQHINFALSLLCLLYIQWVKKMKNNV